MLYCVASPLALAVGVSQQDLVIAKLYQTCDNVGI